MSLDLKPSALIDLRTSLVRWCDTPESHAMQKIHMESIPGLKPAGPTPVWAEQLQDSLVASEVFLVADHLLDLCREAGRTLPKIEHFGIEDLLTPYGLIAWNGGPIATVEIEGGERQDIVAVSWSPMTLHDGNGRHPLSRPHPGVILQPWEDRDVIENYPGDSFSRERIHTAAVTLYRRIVPVAPIFLTFGSVNAPPDLRPGARVFDEMDKTHSDVCRVTMATWLLMRQTITTTETHSDKKAARRAARAGIDKARISIVRLRHVSHGPTNPNTVKWSCRWIVRGHWRNQWLPSRQTHRPVWISPHTKGPDHAPLKVPEKVIFFDR